MMKNNDSLFKINTVSQTNTECLGIPFENEVARRQHFLAQLQALLNDADFRGQTGFPSATEEAILALSDPPYYTACPNPWMSEIIKQWQGQPEVENSFTSPPITKYQTSKVKGVSENQSWVVQEPFAADVSEGKNDPIYTAHSYHTKVPHKAIMRYILHYTRPGDIVFDGFCGTGMTGVAAQLCGDKKTVEELGYRVLSDGTIEALEGGEETQENGRRIWRPFSQLGVRYAVLNDLSPSASFIAYNYNIPINELDDFKSETTYILQQVEKECGWLYQTVHITGNANFSVARSVVLGERDCPDGMILGQVNYMVWSDVFVCPSCTGELIFWQVAVDQDAEQVKTQFSCPHCATQLTKRSLERAWSMRRDRALQKMLRQPKQVPVLINYSVGKQRYQKTPDAFDLALLEKIEQSDIPYWFPIDMLPTGDKTKEPCRLGLTHVHHFYTKRNLWVFATFIHWCQQSRWRNHLLGIAKDCQSYATKMIKLNIPRLLHQSGQFMGFVSGTFYLPSLHAEQSTLLSIINRAKKVLTNYSRYPLLKTPTVLISNGDSGHLNIPDDCIDYIFLDPPFGSNIMYSELNFLWEAWLQVFTDSQPEAIVNQTQQKTINEYRFLMINCFKEAFRILKPGCWLTVEFSNTQASVWNTIQTALLEAGFVIANVSALDKKQGSFNAVTNTTSVKQDLIISAYKPQTRLINVLGTLNRQALEESGVWEFVSHHLQYLPLIKSKGSELEFVAEREPRILYDRTVAYFVSHGYPVPLSSQAFQAGLKERFKERDGMVFLEMQVAEYEQKRQRMKEAPQLELFVCDERSAIDWLYYQLKRKPATRQEIHPAFIQLLGAGWKKHEVVPELDSLLELNFLKYHGKGEVPKQIYHYFQKIDEYQHLSPHDPWLQQQAAERWYVPDIDQAKELEKIREVLMLKEFKHYLQQKKKNLTAFRLEVLKVGFKHAWEHKDYQTIVEISSKVPTDVLYQDEKLLQFYDLAVTRLENQSG